MIEAIIVLGNEKIQDIMGLRKEIFVEELGCSEVSTIDAYDEAAYQVIVYDNQKPVACGRLLTHPLYTVDKVGVLSTMRGNYFGDLVVKMLLDKAFNLGASSVGIQALPLVTGFFDRIGFQFLQPNTLFPDINMFIQKDMIVKCQSH